MWEQSFKNEINKLAKDMPSFTAQNRPAKVKEIYLALKRDHPNMPAGKKARIAESTYNKMQKNAQEKIFKTQMPKLPSTGTIKKKTDVSTTDLKKLMPQKPVKIDYGTKGPV